MQYKNYNVNVDSITPEIEEVPVSVFHPESAAGEYFREVEFSTDHPQNPKFGAAVSTTAVPTPQGEFTVETAVTVVWLGSKEESYQGTSSYWIGPGPYETQEHADQEARAVLEKLDDVKVLELIKGDLAWLLPE